MCQKKCCTCHETCTSRFRKRCACHEICTSRFIKCCACYEICISKFTKWCLHFEVCKVLCLRRNLHFEVQKVVCLPRNLHFEVHKVLRLSRNLHVQTSRFTATNLPRKLHFEALTAPISCACHEKSTLDHQSTRFPLRLPRKVATMSENARAQRERSPEKHPPLPPRFREPAQSKCTKRILRGMNVL